MKVNLRLKDLTQKGLLRLIYVTVREEIMALNEAIQNLTAEVSTQLEQTAKAISDLRDTVEELTINKAERAELRAQLDVLKQQNEDAATAIQAQADALAADNEPVGPTEPEEGQGPETVDPFAQR